jgi:hypothetical protein
VSSSGELGHVVIASGRQQQEITPFEVMAVVGYQLSVKPAANSTIPRTRDRFPTKDHFAPLSRFVESPYPQLQI